MVNNLIPYFIEEQYRSGLSNGNFEGYAIFVDISGFTKLTQSLLKRGSPGAEILSNILNDTFAPMVKMVYQQKGFIPYFAGDAFTGIFSKEKNEKDIVGLAQQIVKHFDDHYSFNTQFGKFEVKIKIGISYGNIEWGIVGNDNKTFFFRGDAINNSAFSQTKAKEQEIVLDTVFRNKIKNDFKTRKVPKSPYYLFSNSNLSVPIKEQEITNIGLDIDILSKFQPEKVIEFNQIGEFRSVVSVFISFKGLDSFELLNQFGTQVLELFENHSGYFKEIDFSDKGGVIVGFWGAPVSYENNQERAMKFALAIQKEAENYSKEALEIRVGITEGTAFTGLIGSKERVQYAAIGNRVNLAARLMATANWNEILVDDVIAKNRSFHFVYKDDLQYKGLSGAIPTYELVDLLQKESAFFVGSLVGRTNEYNSLKQFIEQGLHFPFMASVSFLYGEAGLGKSRMTYELRQHFERNTSWVTCQADQILKKPFNPFIYFISNFFNQSGKNNPEENLSNFQLKITQLIASLHQNNSLDLAAEMERSSSIFKGLLALDTKDSLWNELDAKGRYQNILESLSAFFISIASINPLIIELEDGHWFDNDSLIFLKVLIKKIQAFPISILITSRYQDDGEKPEIIDRYELENENIPYLDVELKHLKADSVRELAEKKLEGKIDDVFAKVLTRASNGNPFYTEQILAYFEESGLLKLVDNIWTIEDEKVELSYSINTILMSRIDRLSALVKETVKAAAVIGREFDVPVLAEVMKTNQSYQQEVEAEEMLLTTQIKKAEKGNIWRAINELKYIFKHALLREAIYNMQLKSRLQNLHNQIGLAIEKLYEEQRDIHLFELAFHFEQAKNIDKTKYYLKKAGDYSRRNFQNQQAINFYDKLLTYYNEHSDLESIVITILKKNKVLELIGNWKSCEKGYKKLLKYKKRLDNDMLVARIYNNYGHLLMLQSKYKLSENYLKLGIDIFNVEEDLHGKFVAFGHLGHVYFRQGMYPEAKTFFSKSIELSQSLPYMFSMTQIVANLGLTYMNQGYYQEGIDCQLDQLEKAKKANDKQGMASLFTNLGIVYFEKGDYDQALENYESGLKLSQELKNKHLIAIAIGCIGSVYDKKGDNKKALKLYKEDLVLCKELGDKQGISIVHGLLGGIFYQRSSFKKANKHFKKQLKLCKEINYQKGASKALLSIGKSFIELKKIETASKNLQKAIKLSRKIAYKPVLTESLIYQYKCYLKMGLKKESASMTIEIKQLLTDVNNLELKKLFKN